MLTMGILETQEIVRVITSKMAIHAILIFVTDNWLHQVSPIITIFKFNVEKTFLS